MLNGAFSRGTTPTHIFPLPDSLVISDLDDFSITYRQKNRNILIKDKENVMHQNGANENNIVVRLSQTETLMFNPKIKIVQVQVKGKIKNDIVNLGVYAFRLEECFDDNEM